MKKVFQEKVDEDNGDCVQAVIASLFDMELKDVPPFIEFGEHWFIELRKFILSKGYRLGLILHNRNYTRLCHPTLPCFVKKEKFHEPSILKPSNLMKFDGGVNGYHFASVLSPNYFSFSNGLPGVTHAVIINDDMEIVHDPNPSYHKHLVRYPLADVLKYNGIIDVYKITRQ